ncbi:unnamed protein product [Soboliphyme baturini]|uniref:Major sperm protein n=1 Tax=Soboliphyme baturini TaxID=241478 RepID=A0A183J840_9BILA|nr:unnamed protein product [Soboliphyme baturini]
MLTNDGKVPIAIKVKTTNKQLFMVDVVHSIIQPGESKKLRIKCLPFYFNPKRNIHDRIGIFYCKAPNDAVDAKKVWRTAVKWKKHIMDVAYNQEREEAHGKECEKACSPAGSFHLSGSSPPVSEDTSTSVLYTFASSYKSDWSDASTSDLSGQKKKEKKNEDV